MKNEEINPGESPQMPEERPTIGNEDPRDQENPVKTGDNEIPLTRQGLSIFVNPQLHYSSIQAVIEQLRIDSPELFDRRKSEYKNVNEIDVFTNKDLLIQKMLENGLQLKDPEILPPQENDLLLNTNVETVFSAREKGWDAFWAEIAHLREIRKDYFVMRLNKVRYVEVFTDRKWLIEYMVSKGFPLKDPKEADLPPLEPTDFPLNTSYLKYFFRNGKVNISFISQAVEAIRQKYPNQFTSRRNEKQVVEVFKNRALFVQEMLHVRDKKTHFSLSLSEPALQNSPEAQLVEQPQELMEKFFQAYNEVVSGSGKVDTIIVLIENEPISWEVAYDDVTAKTVFGLIILKKLRYQGII
jgi:hypothetical protein